MEPRIEEIEAQPVAGIRTRVRLEGIGERIGELVPELQAALGDRIAGPLLARYHAWDGEGGEMEVAFPVREPIDATGRIEPGELPAGRAVVAEHVGPYDGLRAVWEAGTRWVQSQGLERRAPGWESYVRDCSDTTPEELLTRVVWPIV